MPFYSIPNLSSSNTTPCVPWEVAANFQRPIMETKEEFRLWCNDPTTEHAFITAYEGRVPQLRVSETNPAVRMSGFILDYDAVPDIPPEQAIMARAPHGLRPAYVSRTFSGHCRVLYIFEQPIPLFTEQIARDFLLKCRREFRVRRLLPGLEDEAINDVSKTYEIGSNWIQIGPALQIIPFTTLMAWLADASSQARWDEEGPNIPLDVIREEIQRRWPDRQWPNGWDNFEEGARGPRFWVDDATDPTAAIVRSSGMQYFSDGGGFLRWEFIFGAAFVNQWADDRMGRAITAFAFDGKDFWQKSLYGRWGKRSELEVKRHLRIVDKLSKKAPGPNDESEIERTIHKIQTVQRVEIALPVLFRPDGIVDHRGIRVVNTSTVRPVTPVPDLGEWGLGFPKIAFFLDNAIPAMETDDPDGFRQRNHFLSWLKHFYVGALNETPSRGLALFLAGPAGAGKTLLNKGIIGRLMGGAQDASKYLLNEDKFNEFLFEYPVWAVDDAVAASDDKGQRELGQMVKHVVANDTIIIRKMYGAGRDAEWLGRPVTTLNDDPESLRLLPQTDINIMDKIMLILMAKINEAGWEMTDDEIAQELPYFGAFLRDWIPPEYCRASNPRFGVATFAHPKLVEAAGSTNRTADFEEVLMIWRTAYFRPGGAGENDENWSGNPTELHKTMNLNEDVAELLKAFCNNGVWMGRHLNKLVKVQRPYISSPYARRYVITRPSAAELASLPV